MNSNGVVEWAVVGSDIGPLLLASTGAGLVSVVFHARPEMRGRALGQLRTRLGAEPVESPGSDRLAEPIPGSRRTSRDRRGGSRSTWTGR